MISALALLSALAVLATLIWPPGNAVLTHNGQVYRYIHYAPNRPATDPVLLVVLHGYGGSAEDMRRRSEFDRLARTYSFDVIYVQGLPDDLGVPHWNAGLGMTDRDDVGFLEAFVRRKQQEFGFAPDHTFLVGESNGGYMAHALACTTDGLMGGFANVIGTMSRTTLETCAPEMSVPGLLVHGTADDVIFGDGVADDNWQSPRPAAEIAAFWAERTGGQEPRDFHPVGWALERDWRTVEGKLVSRYYEIDELGHEWPTLEMIGIEGADVVWAFFEEVLRQ